MRKIALLLAVLAVSLTASAQFEEGKKYVGVSATGLDLNYNGSTKFSCGLEAKGGYFLEDNLMLMGNVGYTRVGGDDPSPDRFVFGAMGRYYIIQNGIYLGAGVNYKHSNHSYNDIMPTVEVGYAFFINRTVTIEPALYYEQSMKNHGDYSNVGIRLGLGVYLFTNKN